MVDTSAIDNVHTHTEIAIIGYHHVLMLIISISVILLCESYIA